MSNQITVPVPNERIASALCCAFEGGSNYWYTIVEFHEPTEYLYRFNDDGEPYRPIDYPMNPGGFLMIDGDDGKTYKLDRAAIDGGVRIMAEKYPHQYGNMVGENDDADTGDVLLQCCLFGELIYS